MKKEVKNVSLCIQPLPLAVVSCRGGDGRSNALVVGFAANASLAPAMVMVGIAPERFSHHLIKESGCFVINFPPLGGFRKEYDYLGSRSGRDVDKFKRFGLTASRSREVAAPSIGECHASFECVLHETRITRDYPLFVWRVVHARVKRSPKFPRTVHYRGEGRFMLSGNEVSRRRLFRPDMLDQ